MALTREDIDRGDVVWLYECQISGGYRFRCQAEPRLTLFQLAPPILAGMPSRLRDVPASDCDLLVDDRVCGDIGLALVALTEPVQLTPEESEAFERLPDTFTAYDDVLDELAGVERPSGAITHGTPHYRALSLLDRLKAKGAMTCQLRPAPRHGDGLDHLRCNIFIRQRVGDEPWHLGLKT